MENPQRVEIETLSEPFGYVERYSVDYEPLFVVRRETVFIKYGSRPGFRTELHIYFYDRKQKGEKL